MYYSVKLQSGDCCDLYRDALFDGLPANHKRLGHYAVITLFGTLMTALINEAIRAFTDYITLAFPLAAAYFRRCCPISGRKNVDDGSSRCEKRATYQNEVLKPWQEV